MKLTETGLRIINIRVHLLDLEQPTMVVSMIQISDTLSSKLLLVRVTLTQLEFVSWPPPKLLLFVVLKLVGGQGTSQHLEYEHKV